MRIFIPSLGVTFLIPSDKGSHLHFILTFPLRRKKSEEVLVVGITSTKVDPDFTLSISDHPFIKHKSYINYPQAQIISVETIKRNLATADLEKRFILKETADLSVVKYICSFESLDTLCPYTEIFVKKPAGTQKIQPIINNINTRSNFLGETSVLGE